MADLSSSGSVLFVFIIVFTIICGGVLGLRYWAARIARRKFYADDAFIVLAYCFATALSGVVIWAVFNGCGKHLLELTPYEIEVQGKLYFLSGILWLLGSVFVKLTVLWLYSRIFATPQFRRWSYGIMALVVCYGISFLVVYQTNCRPVSQIWHPTPEGSCRDATREQFATIGVNLGLDIAIVLLPMPTLWKLNMPQRNKLVVTLMFSIGLITIAVLIWRLVVTIESSKHPLDYTYYLATVGLVALLEAWLGIIVATIPTLAPVFNSKLKPALSKLKSSANNSNQASSGSNFQLKSYKQKRPRGLYSELDETRVDRDFVPLGDHAAGIAVTTEFGSRHENPSFGTLETSHTHVQRDVESQKW
ncbi:integral membrane protein [Xylariomycetidae sp. FL2044]|nr:integral membrane protein [Xylariomycetidae sp. FL2044]